MTAAGLLVLFLGSLLLPVYFDVAGLRLTPIRVFLLLGFVPLVIRWLSGAAGRITAGDVFFCLHGAWIGIALFAVHGSSRIAFAGISIVEVLGAYLAGRVLIRNVTDYRTFFRYFLIALALLAPFVLMENLTGRLYFSQLLKPLDTLQKVQADYADMRMGLFRAQGVVDHPILWGVLCSLGIANAYFLWKDTPVRRLILAGFAGAMTFTSLSSGPLLAVTLQVLMIGWGWVTRNAWWALVGLVVLAYVGIDVLSNRSPIPVLISYLTFNRGQCLHAPAHLGLRQRRGAAPSAVRHRPEQLDAPDLDGRVGRQLLAQHRDALRPARRPAAGGRHRGEPHADHARRSSR